MYKPAQYVLGQKMAAGEARSDDDGVVISCEENNVGERPMVPDALQSSGPHHAVGSTFGQNSFPLYFDDSTLDPHSQINRLPLVLRRFHFEFFKPLKCL